MAGRITSGTTGTLPRLYKIGLFHKSITVHFEPPVPYLIDCAAFFGSTYIDIVPYEIAGSPLHATQFFLSHENP